MLRRRQPRRRRVERQGLRRHDRRPPSRNRRGVRRARVGSRHARAARHCLHDHGRAARRERQGHHRQWRRRVRRARLRLGLRRRDGRARMALLHGAGRSRARLRERADGRDGRARPGTANGGASAAAARCGTRWPTIPSSISSISARATARRGIAALRSPGGGDNLFLSSIVALRPDTASTCGTTRRRPAKAGTTRRRSPSSLADLTIDGAHAPRVMQAPKNGFFYVLDAATGQLLSARQVRGRELGERRRSCDGPTASRIRPRATTKRGAPWRCSRRREARTTGTRWHSAR